METGLDTCLGGRVVLVRYSTLLLVCHLRLNIYLTSPLYMVFLLYMGLSTALFNTILLIKIKKINEFCFFHFKNKGLKKYLYKLYEVRA